MVLWISRGKCGAKLWCEIIIIITKTASTFHNGLAATNENLVFYFANNGDFTPRYPSVITPLLQSNFHPRHSVHLLLS